jgi:hypothetical protein
MRAHHRLAASITAAVLAGGLLGSGAAHAGTPTYTWSSRPSPVVLEPPGHQVAIHPQEYCWVGPPVDGHQQGAACTSGGEPADSSLRTVSTTRGLRFWFGMPRWTFVADLTRLGGRHRTFRTPVATLSPRTFRIGRPARRGLYRVWLFGRGPLGREHGDVTVWFEWRVRG